MLLAELTIGATFTGGDGTKWILTEQLGEGEKIQFTLEKVKVEEKEDELIPD